MEKSLPPIPAKRYFTIGEVSELCDVKPYVLRYWEQEFTQLRPMKRRGNRRYYQHHEVLLVRRIRELLYDQGFTISGARNRLADGPMRLPADGLRGARPGTAIEAPAPARRGIAEPPPSALPEAVESDADLPETTASAAPDPAAAAAPGSDDVTPPNLVIDVALLRRELAAIRLLLEG
jgi:DNA-binding transcriptional MerR regulator